MKTSTALIGAAGEHYVAYLLSKKGYCVGLSRGGSPYVDIMISNSDGVGVAIQVKTSSGARREKKRNPENSRWEFDVGKKAKTLSGPTLFYAFVDLNWGNEPNVFIVPSCVVKDKFEDTNYPRNIFWIMDDSAENWRERFDLIENVFNSFAE